MKCHTRLKLAAACGAGLLNISTFSTVSASLTLYEGFDYTVGDLSGQNGGTGFTNAWAGSISLTGGGTASASQKVAANSLSITNYPFTTTGNHLEDSSANTVFSYRTLSSPIATTASSVRYLSYLLRKEVPVPDTGTSEIAQLRISAGGTNRFLSGVNSNESIALTAGGPVSLPAGAHVGDTTYLYVVKFVTSATALEDQVFLMVFKDGDLLTNEPTNEADWTLVAPKHTSASANWNILNFVEGLGSLGQIDEIRMGTTWADVGGTATPLRWNVNASGNWTDTLNWQGGVPNAQNAVANLTDAISTDVEVALDTAQTVGGLRFNNTKAYTITGSPALTFDVAVGNGSILVQSGSHAIRTPVLAKKPLWVTVTNAGDTLTLGDASFDAGASLTKQGAGVLAMRNVRADSLSVQGGTLKMAVDGTDAGTSRVGSLAIVGLAVPTAKLDLANNAMVIDYTGATPMTTIAAQIQTGRNSGAWDGNGIQSSAAASVAVDGSNTHKTALGFAEVSAILNGATTFAGQPADADSILIRYTYLGDANLDRTVNALDFNALASAYGTAGSWVGGDWDFSGTVDSLDFTALALNFNLTLTLPASMPGDALDAVVPEPCTAALLAGALILRRRRQIAF